MIEAVNSVVANASLLRSATEQGAQSRSNSAVSVEKGGGNAAPQAPFVSPYIQVDLQYNKAVLQIRDSNTGDVLNQFPSETTLQARQRENALLAAGEKLESNSNNNSLFNATQIASSSGGTSAPQAAPVSVEASSPQIAEAQIASAALNSGAQAGQVQSANVSVTA